MEGNIKIILERKGVGFCAQDTRQRSINGRKHDRVTVIFSKRALSHRVVSGVLSPSVITILNLVKCLSNCSYHSPHWKLELFFAFTLNSSNNSLPPLHCIVLSPFLTQMCIYICVPLSFHCISFSIFFIMCICSTKYQLLKASLISYCLWFLTHFSGSHQCSIKLW
jgi:hypothetical protein